MKKAITCVALLLFVFSCTTSKMLAPTAADVERSKSDFPELTLEELNQGKELFEQKCSTCHELKKPASKTPEQWRQIVPAMVRKANKKEVKIDPAQEQLILKYAVVMSTAKKGK